MGIGGKGLPRRTFGEKYSSQPYRSGRTLDGRTWEELPHSP